MEMMKLLSLKRHKLRHTGSGLTSTWTLTLTINFLKHLRSLLGGQETDWEEVLSVWEPWYWISMGLEGHLRKEYLCNPLRVTCLTTSYFDDWLWQMSTIKISFKLLRKEFMLANVIFFISSALENHDCNQIVSEKPDCYIYFLYD